MNWKLKKIGRPSFDEFYQFIENFILYEYTEYPPEIRKAFWDKDFQRKDLLHGMKEGTKVLFAAIADKKIVGFAVLFLEYGGASYLKWIGVDKNYRGFGIGSRLLEKAMSYARQKHYHFAYLWTESLENIRFYHRRGFALVGLQKEAWYGQDEYLMQKNLSHPHPSSWKINK